MKRTKRLLCALLSLTVVLSAAAAFCVPASAGSTVGTIRLNGLLAPRAEDSPEADNITVPYGSNYEFTNTTKQAIENFGLGYSGAQVWFDSTDWKWLKRTDTFTQDHVYRLALSFWPKSGYSFLDPDEMQFDAGTLASAVKSAVFSPSGYNDGRICLEITFKPVAPPKTISSLNVTGIVRPIIAEPVSTDDVQVSEGFSILSRTLQIEDGGHWKTAAGQYKAEGVYRMDLQLGTLPGYLYAAKIAATVNGGAFDGFGNPIELKKVGGNYRLYFLLEQPTVRDFRIVHYVTERKVDYRSTVLLTTEAASPTDGLHVEWTIKWDNGSESCVKEETLRLENVKQSFRVHAGLWGEEDGKPVSYAVSEEEHIIVRSGFFDRLIAFFRNLFHKLPVVTQEVLGVEICE